MTKEEEVGEALAIKKQEATPVRVGDILGETGASDNSLFCMWYTTGRLGV